jgi:two-component system, cell cycle sensor histidine kinase and response regulator CckA
MAPLESSAKTVPASIVIADNDDLILEAIGELLRSKGYDVHLAHDGLEALQVIRKVKPDYLILDVVMPKLDGSRLCWIIRQDPALRDMPIIAFSSLSAQDFRHFPDLSADAYVAKGAIATAFQNILQAIAHLQAKGRTDIAGGIFGYDGSRPREVVAEMLMEIRHYANIIRALGPGTMELDRDGHILRINAGACEILGRNETQLIGEPIASFFPTRDQETLLHLLGELAKVVKPERCRATVRFADLEIPVQLCSIIEDGSCTGVLLIMESTGVKV